MCDFFFSYRYTKLLFIFIVLVTIIKCINFGCIILAPTTMLVKIRHRRQCHLVQLLSHLKITWLHVPTMQVSSNASCQNKLMRICHNIIMFFKNIRLKSKHMNMFGNLPKLDSKKKRFRDF